MVLLMITMKMIPTMVDDDDDCDDFDFYNDCKNVVKFKRKRNICFTLIFSIPFVTFQYETEYERIFIYGWRF